MKRLASIICILWGFGLLIGCGGSPKQNNHTPPLSMSTLAQQNRFLMTVPTEDQKSYLVVQDKGNNNKEIQLWSKDLKYRLATLLNIGSDYDIDALYAAPENSFIAVVSGKQDPENTARIVSIDYQKNQTVFNTNVYNLPTDYKTHIQYDDNSDILRLGNMEIATTNLYRQNRINAADYISSTHEWVDDMSNWYSQNSSTTSYQDSDYSTGSPSANSDVYSSSTHEWIDDMSNWYSQNGSETSYQDSDYSTGSPSANSDVYSSSTHEWIDDMSNWYSQNGSTTSYQDSEYSTGSPSANSNVTYDPSTLVYLDALYEENKYRFPDQEAFRQQIENLKTKYQNGTVQNSDLTDLGNYINTYGIYTSTNDSYTTSDDIPMKHGTWKGVGHQFWKRIMDYSIELTIGDNEYYFTYVDDQSTCYGSMVVIAKDANSITFREYLNGGACVENYFVLTKIDENHFSYESYLVSTGEHTVSGDVYFSSSSF